MAKEALCVPKHGLVVVNNGYSGFLEELSLGYAREPGMKLKMKMTWKNEIASCLAIFAMKKPPQLEAAFFLK